MTQSCTAPKYSLAVESSPHLDLRADTTLCSSLLIHLTHNLAKGLLVLCTGTHLTVVFDVNRSRLLHDVSIGAHGSDCASLLMTNILTDQRIITFHKRIVIVGRWIYLAHGFGNPVFSFRKQHEYESHFCWSTLNIGLQAIASCQTSSIQSEVQ